MGILSKATIAMAFGALALGNLPSVDAESLSADAASTSIATERYAPRQKPILVDLDATARVGGGPKAAGSSLWGKVVNEMEPQEEAREEIGKFNHKYSDLIEEIEETKKALEAGSELQFDDVRRHAEKGIQALSDILKDMAPGGDLNTSVRNAIVSMEATRDLAIHSTSMTAEDIREVVSVWEGEIKGMRKAQADLEAIRQNLIAQIGSFDGAREYVTHMEMASQARNMRKALEKMISTLNTVLDDLKFQIPSS